MAAQAWLLLAQLLPVVLQHLMQCWHVHYSYASLALIEYKQLNTCKLCPLLAVDAAAAVQGTCMISRGLHPLTAPAYRG